MKRTFGIRSVIFTALLMALMPVAASAGADIIAEEATLLKAMPLEDSAILRDAQGRTHVVKLGETVGDYKVVRISETGLVLERAQPY